MSRILPILFNIEMVRAILEERKTVTRRAIKKSQCMLLIKKDTTELEREGLYAPFDGMTDAEYLASIYKPPCQWGDTLYVRETWFKYYGKYIYRASAVQPDLFSGMWRPSIHMPKEAARIWLKVTDVRVERLQDMKLSDFLDEGVVIREESFNDPDNAYWQARSAFKNIWDSTIKKSDLEMYGWDANPWVWVIEFERCEKPNLED